MLNTIRTTIRSISPGIRPRHLRRTAAGVAAGGVLAAVLTVAAPGTASAMGDDFAGYGINIRSAPAIGATVVGHGNRGDGLTSSGGITNGGVVYCPNPNAAWWHIRDLRTGVVGWVSDCYVIGV